MHLFLNYNKDILIYFFTVETYKDMESRTKLVISKAVRKYVKINFILRFKTIFSVFIHITQVQPYPLAHYT